MLMATIEFFNDNQELKSITSAVRATITAPFFGNNCKRYLKMLSRAYYLAKNSPGTVELTGMPVYEPKKLGLPKGANQLLLMMEQLLGVVLQREKLWVSLIVIWLICCRLLERLYIKPVIN